MEKIIHFTVRDPHNLSPIQTDAIERARKLHPNWEVKVWRVPAIIQGYNFLLEKYWPKVNSGAQFSDLFRLDVLYRFGGVYVDSDLRLFKPLDDLVDRFDFFIASENGLQLTNALIGARKESTVLRNLIDELDSAEPDWTSPPNMTTGPYFFSQHLKCRTDITVLPRESFYTYGAFSAAQKTIHRHSYGEHLWENSWKSSEINPPLPVHDVLDRTCQLLLRLIKKPLKYIALFGFRIWRRLQSIDPTRRVPRPKQRWYECSSELLIQTIHDYKIMVDGRDLRVAPELVFNGFYKLPEERFLLDVAKGGDWVIDIGANIGTFSLLAAKQVGPFGRVFAFEANPRSSRLMAKSLIINWMNDRVIQRQVAVGEIGGTTKLTFVRDHLSDRSIGDITGSATMRPLWHEDTITSEVPCICLDEEFAVDLPIKILKISAEGSGAGVLAGADRLLKQRCIDFVLMELPKEQSGSPWRETVKQLNCVIMYGYAICTLTQDGRIVDQNDLAAATRAETGNIVLVAKEQHRLAALVTNDSSQLVI